MAIRQLPPALLYTYYIILGEFGIAILFATLAKLLTRWVSNCFRRGIFARYAIAYTLTDRVLSP